MRRVDGRPQRRYGFTLPEVMIALVVAGLVLLGARATVEAVRELAGRIAAATGAGDRERNGERLMRRLVASLTTGDAEDERFAGDPSSARFPSRCDEPAGWTERCLVNLRVESSDSGFALVAWLDDAPPLVVLRARHRLELRYLHDARDGGRWFRSWGSSIIAPAAIGITRDDELLVLPVGTRG